MVGVTFVGLKIHCRGKGGIIKEGEGSEVIAKNRARPGPMARQILTAVCPSAGALGCGGRSHQACDGAHVQGTSCFCLCRKMHPFESSCVLASSVAPPDSLPAFLALLISRRSRSLSPFFLFLCRSFSSSIIRPRCRSRSDPRSCCSHCRPQCPPCPPCSQCRPHCS